MNRDALFGIVGGVLLVAAMVATFYYEAAYYKERDADETVRVTWTTERTDFTPQSRNLGGMGAETTVTFRVDAPNITRVDFTITWPANAAGLRDTLVVSVQPPAGANVSHTPVTSPSGSIPISIVVNPMPEAENATGPDNETILRDLAGHHTSTRGVGEWRVTIRDQSAQPTTTNASPTQVTTSGSFTVYKPKLG